MPETVQRLSHLTKMYIDKDPASPRRSSMMLLGR